MHWCYKKAYSLESIPPRDTNVLRVGWGQKTWNWDSLSSDFLIPLCSYIPPLSNSQSYSVHFFIALPTVGLRITLHCAQPDLDNTNSCAGKCPLLFPTEPAGDPDRSHKPFYRMPRTSGLPHSLSRKAYGGFWFGIQGQLSGLGRVRHFKFFYMLPLIMNQSIKTKA